MQIDLRSYVAQRVGKWFENPDWFQPHRLVLGNTGDGVALVGPLRIRVCLEGENLTRLYEGSSGITDGELAGTLASAVTRAPLAAHKHVVYSYVLDIPPLQIWPYLVRGDEIVGRLGANRGYNVIIQPAGGDVCTDPGAGKHECECGCKPSRCRCQSGCGCGAGGGCHGGCGGKHPGHDDLPCDYAVTTLPDIARFFPAACEPCPPDACISAPAPPGPAGLLVRPARGGCERPRYFTGMLVTREDMEAEQRFFRLKMKLHNRAAGAGVVWGLCAGLDGNDVVVWPGYAVDCCGNDLTVTSAYRVDGPSLVRDPAGRSQLAQPGSHRLHLLLEYLECAEDARPVHGDPCAAAATSCEMSRMRETVRLRLVPPRDFDARGPIQAFLDAFKDRTTPSPPAGPTPSAPSLPAPEVPFSFDVTIPQQRSTTLQPSVTGDVTGTLAVNFIPNTRTYPLPQVTLNPAGTWNLSGSVVELVKDAAGTAQPPRTVGQLGPGPLTWTAPYPPPGGVVEYDAVWRATRPDGAFEEATTRLALAVLDQGDNERRLLLAVPATRPKVGRGTPRLPCLEEPCAPGEGMPLFPVAPPFLHEDPWHPGQAADPKVLVLAALYALLSMQEAQGVAAPSRALLYHAAERLLFGREVNGAQLVDELRKLFAAWCKASLYPGPVCEGEPHGVVIGCALVAGGEVQHVDPWGGRRYVVHYPLLAHWGSTFGIVPPDVLVQRLFSIICCVAGLPGIGGTRLPERPVGVAVPAASGTAVPVGSALLTFERAGLTEEGRLEVGRTVHVGWVEFVARLLDAIRRPLSAEPRPRVRYVLDESAGIALIAPDDEAAPGPARPTRLSGAVARIATARGDDLATPPLLRPFAHELSLELVRALPLPEEEEGVIARLRAAGVSTAGALLDRDPQVLHRDVLSGAGGRELGALVERAEKSAADVTHAVAAALKATRRQGLSSRDDLADEATRKALVDDLAKRLAERGVSRELVEAALARVAPR
jgi:hypothetical protein